MKDITMDLTRDIRKEIYKHRFSEGYTGWKFPKWNSWFKSQPKELQEQFYWDYMNEKDENIEEEAGEEMLNTKCVSVPSPNYAQAIAANWVVESNSFGCGNATPALKCAVKQETKESTMDTRTEAQQAKDYLITSLNQAIYTKREEESEAYNLGDQRPRTIGELKEAIKNGWITLATGYEDRKDTTGIGWWSDYVMISDPAKKPDPEGYEKAVELIAKDASEVKDQIVVFGPEKGLEALNAFKAKVYH